MKINNWLILSFCRSFCIFPQLRIWGSLIFSIHIASSLNPWKIDALLFIPSIWNLYVLLDLFLIIYLPNPWPQWTLSFFLNRIYFLFLYIFCRNCLKQCLICKKEAHYKLMYRSWCLEPRGRYFCQIFRLHISQVQHLSRCHETQCKTLVILFWPNQNQKVKGSHLFLSVHCQVLGHNI